MARPVRKRFVREKPQVSYYKPQGISMKNLEIVYLNLEEFECLKHKDYEFKTEMQASEEMKISQSTFNRIYIRGKRKVVKALVEGLAIKIEGGIYKMPNFDRTGPDGKGPRTGRGLGKCNSNNDELIEKPRRFNRGQRPLRRGLGRNNNNN